MQPRDSHWTLFHLDIYYKLYTVPNVMLTTVQYVYHLKESWIEIFLNTCIQYCSSDISCIPIYNFRVWGFEPWTFLAEESIRTVKMKNNVTVNFLKVIFH